MIIIDPYRGTTGGGGGYDTDAQDWIDRVEAADGAALEEATRVAFNELVLDLKTTITHRGNSITIWDKIDYCLPMFGARTVAGMMEEIKGATAATAVSFGSGDLNRKEGLTGGSPRRIAVPFNGVSTPQDDASLAVYVTAVPSVNGAYLTNGSGNTTSQRQIRRSGTDMFVRVNSDTARVNAPPVTGLHGGSRFTSTGVDYLYDGAITSVNTHTSNSNQNRDFTAFSRGTTDYSNVRQGFIFIGRDIPLLTLEAYADSFYAAIAAAF